MALKFLVWGGKGWIGAQTVAAIEATGNQAVHATSRADDEVAVAKELDEVKPDRGICLIGRTRGGTFTTIDYLEQKGKLRENVRDNMWGPVVLSYACQKRAIHLVYMGTGCVFHYDDDEFKLGNGKGFTEKDDANFFGSSYSTVKGFTDRMMRMMFNENTLNVRIRMPITPDDSPYNFVTKIVNYERVVNIPNSMTVLPMLLPKMIDMSINKTAGTVNLTHPGTVSHNEVLDLYKKHVDPAYTYQNFSVEEQDKILLGGRSNNLLDTTRLSTLYPDVLDMKAAMEQVCIQMAKAHPNGICTQPGHK
jgi:3,5-epimerase/4-reductase